MVGLLENAKQYSDYIPFILIALFMIADDELHKHAVLTSCQIMITIITFSIFFISTIQFQCTKFCALVIAGVAWIILIWLKKCLLFKQPTLA